MEKEMFVLANKGFSRTTNPTSSKSFFIKLILPPKTLLVERSLAHTAQ